MARILQVCNSGFYLTHFLVPLVTGLLAAGHEVECAYEGPEGEGVLPKEVVVHPLVHPRSPSPPQFATAIWRLRQIIRRGRYDCVDSHNRNASIVGRVAGWLEHVPVNLYTAHGFYFHDGQGPLAYGSTVALEALLASITDYTLSQSGNDVSFMTKHQWIEATRIENIGNGIDTRRFSPRPGERKALETRLGLRPDRFRVVSTGRLVRGKGFMDLLLAFVELHRQFDDAELLIIGGNVRYDIEPFHQEFLAKTVELGVADAVTVTGMVKNVEAYLGASDLFVLPSYREGMPRALLEAMAMGLPVIATDIRGCKEIVRASVDGWLYRPRDVTRLEELLKRLHDDSVGRASVGRHARERVVSSFDERDYVARQVNAIGRLVGEPIPIGRPPAMATASEVVQ